jgi:hypothetical protein
MYGCVWWATVARSYAPCDAIVETCAGQLPVGRVGAAGFGSRKWSEKGSALVKLVKCVIVLAGLLAAAPVALLAQQTDQETNCTDRCVWIQGLGWKCGAGSDGCKCHDEEYSCYYYNCGGPLCGPAEEDEDNAESQARAAARGPTLGVKLVEVGGELFVAVDGCLKNAPMMLRVGAHTAIEIVERLSAFSHDQ